MFNHKFITAALVVLMNIAAAWAENENDLDIINIEKLTGNKGTYDKNENVFKIVLPRTDIYTTVGQTKITPPMGLSCQAAFTLAGDSVIVMGDLVLLENQVNPVMSAALDNGLDVTALHNQYLWDYPKVMFMHIGGRGDQKKLAQAVGKVFAEIEKNSILPAELQKVRIDPSKTNIDTDKIDSIFQTQGKMIDGAYKFTFGRITKMEGYQIGNAMGVNTWAAFVGTDDLSIVDGEFAMYEYEVQTILKILRHSGINIVAIHNHMLMESPRVVFLHFWGVGKTTDLAKALKAAMDTQKKTAEESMK